MRSTIIPIDRRDVTVERGLPVLRPERLILDAPLFGFTRDEVENAIDSAIRLRLISERRLRERVLRQRRQSISGGRVLVDALVDTGGESRLERMFLALVRRGGLGRPDAQRVYRAGSRTVARVDFVFPNGLIVEVNGFGWHSNRVQMQRDAARHTELVLLGHRVITFMYDDVRDRPAWVLMQVRRALATEIAA